MKSLEKILQLITVGKTLSLREILEITKECEKIYGVDSKILSLILISGKEEFQNYANELDIA